mmetsp:Transcript_20340/g.25145  ORF Transcript_20340/g.25145 Transcript_20340/m.25145 type:complete len:311 (+) Transcript_20340:211-1143(+)|eukprot:CAMPEP_0172499028 /NCGR_PEP_ID=MMETSP1066-20121228/121169_1 /TAXON_ID=671091 /ORGANISM="Coscinodiscus wailesii, Strain CCMP2513" /LENGTH=310 /DNA_ID=CAMNT_0013272565 /DNA_START=211 /DNA_END=1143 /DNA_ORIENTATION=-
MGDDAAATDVEIQAQLAAKLGETFKELMTSSDSEGIAWTAGTSQAIAHDRAIESAREDALFNDPLAKYLVGERGEKISDTIDAAMSLHFKIIGFHRMWTAVRTKFINDTIAAWIDSLFPEEINGGETTGAAQVTNLGAGVDTRAFWLECLTRCERYVEIDVASINGFKERTLAQLDPVPHPKCQRQVITMDFEVESLADLRKHNYDASLPTLWILEGLVMYMKKVEVIKLINDVVTLSPKGSCVVINYFESPNPENAAANIDYMEEIILANAGWTGGREYLGGKVIDYGRFPKNTPPCSNMGFGTYYYQK